MKGFPFSAILYVDHEGSFEAAVSNLMSNGLAEMKGQMIVIDPYVSEQVRQVCARYERTIYLPLEDAEMPAAYQEGLQHAEGDYVHFTLASSSYAQNAYRAVSNALEAFDSNQIVALRSFFIDESGAPTPYGGSNLPNQKIEQIDLLKSPHSIHLLLQAYFFPRHLLTDHAFRPELHDDALYQFLLDVLLESPSYIYLRNARYCYTVPLEDNPSLNPLQYHLWWYHQSVCDFLLPLLKREKETRGQVPRFLQVACFYLIHAKFNCNYNDRNKGILADAEAVQQFISEVSLALTYIDNTVLMSKDITSFVRVKRAIRMLMLRCRADALGRDVQIVDTSDSFLALMLPKDSQRQPDHDYANYVSFIGRSSWESLLIRVINYENGTLHIDANVSTADFIPSGAFEIYAVVTSKKNGHQETATYYPEHLQVYPLDKCFGVTFMRKTPVQFHIPVGKAARQTIQFFLSYQGEDHPIKVKFNTYHSRLIGDSPYSYWVFRKGWMLTWSEDTTLVVRKFNWLFHLKRELLFALDLYKSTPDRGIALRGLLLRLVYWLTLPYYSKKHIWVTYDKQYKAGDNGEYMYQYCRAHHRGEVEIYYSLRKDSLDYDRMVKADKKHILTFGTFHSQLIWLMAEVILNTHTSVAAQYNPSPAYNRFTKDLQRGDAVCIQHGLTIQKIAQYQNRTFDNTKLYCCASPYEIRNLSHPIYGFDAETLKLDGLARYDGLKNRDQKIILITPSWRRNVVNTGVANIRKTHNNNFRDSSYFRIYNALINDQSLIDCARAHGYRIVYLLHPAMSAQIDDFDRNDYVELVPATGAVSYEKILCESSLMVTDYSGVQFDFAYMRKPLIYYHPAELPPHYGEGDGMIYSTMGFGPICTSHREVVEAICASIEQSCQMEREYVQRADDFFAFNDHNNCQRIYDEVKRWQKKRS